MVAGQMEEQMATATAYETWQQGEGIPIYTGAYVGNLYTLELKDWARVGQKGAFVNLANQQVDDAQVIEIAPRGQTDVLHHLFEAVTFVVSGRGATTLWQEGHPKRTVEWQRGSVFSPPINCYYQHYNGSGEEPARLFTVTNAPMVINMFRNADFAFADKYVFADRFAGEEDYFSGSGEEIGRDGWISNFVPDIRSFTLIERIGNRAIRDVHRVFMMANNQMAMHCSEFETGTYKKAHRHGVGAHVIVLSGTGYSLLWREGEEQQKVDWQDGSVLSPREQEYHQHFNTSPEPARYLAVRLGALDPRRWGGEVPTHQIEHEYENRAVYQQYIEECKKHGATVTQPLPAYVS
jgi:mannose-6-phosphate isomerase-like protein (cupin superfamily)